MRTAFTVLVVLAAGVVAFLAYTRGGENGGRFGAQGVLGESITQTNWPDVAPAFTAEQLTSAPTNAWITNGGTLYNQRYSPLDDIDDGNVQNLKGVWLTHLRASGVAAKYSAEAQPIFYNGILYVPTGADDVFAVDVETGNILWQYQGNLDPAISTVCCGWLSRGVALGDGKLYLGKLDGSLVAIDQKTGQEVWKTQVGRWQDGFTLTHAPLYYDGQVIVGGAGGEFSLRGRVQAFDAKTGEFKWRFWTIPGPGEVGHDTWPADNKAWEHGGASVWQTPAVDPQLGLLYFSTGNASPDLDGSRREGQNLFAASIVAIDAHTGKYRWHFQQVHHDIWDWDAPSPVVLFDIGDRKAIAEPGKTGWLYVLDRVTGEPILPIPETPVEQLAIQKTYPTQPIPQYPQFISNQVSDAHYQMVVSAVERRAAAAGTAPRPVRRVTKMFTPFGPNEVAVMIPGPQGGNNWPPSSYNPRERLVFICGQAGVSGFTQTPNESGVEEVAGKRAVGSTFTALGFGLNGFFTAFDPEKGEIQWQKQWPESCYSGTVTTAGKLVFVGRNNGELQAYRASDGDLLWSFQTGAGANNTPSIFQWKGTQYVAFLAGGNSLGGTAHGDSLWLLSLNGTLGPVQPGTSLAGGTHAGGETPPPPPPTPENPTPPPAGDATRGQIVFSDNCSGCHGVDGLGGNGGPSLRGVTSVSRVTTQVTNGGISMPAFGGRLSQQQIQDVAAYVTQRLSGGTPTP